jgi:hypothetical protein
MGMDTALRRFDASARGFRFVYMRDGILIEEFPDGRCYEIRVEADDSTTPS